MNGMAFTKFELLTSPSFEKMRILSILFLTTQRDPRKFPTSTAVPVLPFPSSYLKVPHDWKCVFILVDWNSLSRNDNHICIYTFGQTFNNTICMRTHNQLHYYIIMSMEVTIFSAVRQTLQCFHLTLGENNRSLVQFFWKEILSSNFH